MNNVFEIRNLVFSYPGKPEPTLKGLTFSIPKGTVFGLLGPSGAGKSTTQKILTKLLEGYSGEILYNGKDLRSFGKPFYEDIGVGFEMPVHFNKLTALENLAYFAGLYRKTIDYEALLRTLGLYEARNQAVGEYSKGMKVRLNFARALLNDPDILFLDEPTNGLDPRNAKIVKDLILNFQNQGKTVVITTHLMGDVEQLCDEVVFITNGKLSEIKSPRDWKLQYGKKEVAVEYLDDGGLRREVFPMERLADQPGFLQALSHPVETIHSGETSLEDIFIRVTGESQNA
ncbi:MAG TPA: ABC transporter ATP-binding protein [Candidatus Izemoplasmatales bacterium]|nr:ABC transporter ATP-binding protein [Bacillota bacterium]HRY78102.1 ABC transporter ATP-binding protein [Candidatus Izemoplasmatales bacterium]